MKNETDWHNLDDFPDDVDPDEIIIEFLRRWQTNATFIKSHTKLLIHLYESDEVIVEMLNYVLASVDVFDEYANKASRYIGRKRNPTD